MDVMDGNCAITVCTLALDGRSVCAAARNPLTGALGATARAAFLHAACRASARPRTPLTGALRATARTAFVHAAHSQRMTG